MMKSVGARDATLGMKIALEESSMNVEKECLVQLKKLPGAIMKKSTGCSLQGLIPNYISTLDADILDVDHMGTSSSI